MVLVFVGLVVFLMFATMAALAITGAKNSDSTSLFSLCSDSFKIAFGTVLGLLAGKKL